VAQPWDAKLGPVPPWVRAGRQRPGFSRWRGCGGRVEGAQSCWRAVIRRQIALDQTKGSRKSGAVPDHRTGPRR